MKLIFIYGPPASGKLTIAEKLSEQTGIALFHNHMTRDLVKELYGAELDENYSLVGKLRSTVLEYCAQNNKDIIFTYVYDGPEDSEAVKIYRANIEDYGGEVCFIELTANKDDLIDRVDNESRSKHIKLTDKDVMEDLTKDMSRFSIPFVESLKINTSELSAEAAVQLIKEKLQL